jgi:hypothetical protein
LDLGFGGTLGEFGWGHQLRWIGMAHAFDEGAFGGLAGDDGTGLGAEGIGGGVEAEVSFSGFGIGAVAGEAEIAEDRQDIAVERGWGLIGPGHGQAKGREKGNQ